VSPPAAAFFVAHLSSRIRHVSHRYVVFGAGRQGTAALHDLVLHADAAAVVAVEPDAARAKRARSRLARLLGRRARTLRIVPAIDDRELATADVVLSCAPYAANVELTRRARRVGVDFCDLGGNPETVARQEALATKRGSAVVPECGVSPGLTNVIAAHCARHHGCDEVTVRCGGLPLVPPDAERNPLRYRLVFSATGLLSEYSGTVPVLRGGRIGRVPALSTIEPFEPGFECSPTSNNSPQVVSYLRSIGVRDYDYATVRYDGHFALVRGWRSLGYLCGDAKRDAELAARLESDPTLAHDPRVDRDRLILRVKGSHARDGMRRGFEYRLDVAADRRTRFSAMELTTCWGITIVAHHMASGRGRPTGFATPERFVDGAWVLEQIERRLATLRT